jgi:hypothetical protein
MNGLEANVEADGTKPWRQQRIFRHMGRLAML